MSERSSTARLRVTIGADDKVRVLFTRGEAEVELRFPYAPEDVAVRESAGDDLTVLIDNLEQLIEHANLEIEAAILMQEAASE